MKYSIYDTIFCREKLITTKNMNWCFGLVNDKLAEVFFEKKGKRWDIFAHALVKESEYTTKKEKEWIRSDTEHVRLSYKKDTYTRIIQKNTNR